MANIVTGYWRVCREFHCKEWADGAVVYDVASGDTHQLTLAASQILNLVHSAPCTRDEIASRALSSTNTDVVDKETLVAIDGMLAHLMELGFIEAIKH